jgi:hypothetical protein
MIRKILSVITGYAVFAVSSALLFIITSHPPHQDAPTAFKFITIIYGLFFSVLSGLIVQLIARQKSLTLNFILALVIFLLATISLLTSGAATGHNYLPCSFSPRQVFWAGG